MTYSFPAIITQEENGMYVARVPSLRGCHTQAKTLTTLYKRLEEAIALCMEVEKARHQPIPKGKFIGLQHIEISL